MILKIERVVFKNEENGFGICKAIDEGGNNWSLKGSLAFLHPGETIDASGNTSRHEIYGPQFEVKEFEYVKTADKNGAVALLSSGIIEGVGPVYASMIVNHLGENTIEILDNDVQQIYKVPSLPKKLYQNIIDGWLEKTHMNELLKFLLPGGITRNFVAKIYKKYGTDAKAIVSENPYRMVDDIEGVGFVKADEVAKAIGFWDEGCRCRAAIIQSLKDAEGSNGHVCLPRKRLFKMLDKYIDSSEETIIESIETLLTEQRIIDYDGWLYSRSMWIVESKCAKFLKERIDESVVPKDIKLVVEERERIEIWAKKKCEEKKIQANTEQIEAVIKAAQSKIFILTGGPGTGKTTTLKLITDWFEEKGLEIRLAAPTGRAARRMNEQTGFHAETIHRMLEYKIDNNRWRFMRDEKTPLTEDVFILDEMSMVDSKLFCSFLRAIPNDKIIVLVGDKNQLPSVGAGDVLHELLRINQIERVELKTVFRQSEHSMIPQYAKLINEGTIFKMENKVGDDCIILQIDDIKEIQEKIIDLCTRVLPEKYNFKSPQVITPIHKGEVGTVELNKKLQLKLNGTAQQFQLGGKYFALGDKVMQTKNDCERGLSNGDIGVVSQFYGDSFYVQFENGIEARYESKNVGELVFAYAITIHKSQGSEFPCIVIPLTSSHYTMLQRKLIYTALTRAKKMCIFVGNYKALAIAINNVAVEDERFTNLSEFVHNPPNIEINFNEEKTDDAFANRVEETKQIPNVKDFVKEKTWK